MGRESGGTEGKMQREGELELTFKLVTRSAVSRRVSWLIWSTMPEILGFSTTASVEFDRRDVAAIRKAIVGRGKALCLN